MKQINSIIIGLILGTLLVFTFVNVFFRSKQVVGSSIAEEVQQLADIFQRIHKTCIILDFDFQKNPINFLHIKSFVGSEVGPMNLVHPEKWEGPYLRDNPTIQDKEYEVVRTHHGYFIVPGTGVRLPNGKIIGTDIILDETADISAMMRDKNKLMYQGKSLAAPLDLRGEIVEMTLGEP